MSIVADVYQFVVGVDTHARTHSYAILAGSDGRQLGAGTFPTSPAGLTRALDWIARHTQGNLSGTLLVVEGTSSYGTRLTARAAHNGYRVVEAPTPIRAGQAKTDQLDAVRAARGVLGLDTTQLVDHREHDGLRDAIAVLVAARNRDEKHRTAKINALTALLRGHDLGIDARHKLSKPTIATVAAWRDRAEDQWLAIIRRCAVELARDIITLEGRLADNAKQLGRLVKAHTPELLTIFGVGEVNAAIIITAWSHPGRIHSEAAFAALAGASPIPASSGNTTRHRLNRGGDRQLNRALTNIGNCRKRHDPKTQAYYAKRKAEGKTDRDIARCLKRYNARRIYRFLTNLDRP